MRVGQLLFAEIIKTHQEIIEEQEINKIVELFDDSNQNACFSIRNIAVEAQKEFKLNPGDWYNPSQISFILSKLYYTKLRMKTPNLGFILFNSNSLFYDQIIDEMLEKSSESCDKPHEK